MNSNGQCRGNRLLYLTVVCCGCRPHTLIYISWFYPLHSHYNQNLVNIWTLLRFKGSTRLILDLNYNCTRYQMVVYLPNGIERSNSCIFVFYLGKGSNDYV